MEDILEQSDNSIIANSTSPGLVVEMELEVVPKTCTSLQPETIVFDAHTIKTWYEDQMEIMMENSEFNVEDYEINTVDVDESLGYQIMHVSVDTKPICEGKMVVLINRILNPDPNCILSPLYDGVTCTASIRKLTIDCHKMTPVLLEITPVAICPDTDVANVFDNEDTNISIRNMQVFVKWLEQQMELSKYGVAYDEYDIKIGTHMPSIFLSVALLETDDIMIQVAIEAITDPDDDGNYSVQILPNGKILGRGPHSNFKYGPVFDLGIEALLKSNVVRTTTGCTEYTRRLLRMDIYNLDETRQQQLFDHVNNVENTLND